MGLLDNYSGVGMSPRPRWDHQLVIRHAMRAAYDELEAQGLLMLSEATVSSNWDDLAPDLVIFNERYIPLTIIEITTQKECSAILQKCEVLMERFPNAEYFVYNYERILLYGSDIERGIWFSSDEYEIGSQYLSMPLLSYLSN